MNRKEKILKGRHAVRKWPPGRSPKSAEDISLSLMRSGMSTTEDGAEYEERNEEAATCSLPSSGSSLWVTFCLARVDGRREPLGVIEEALGV